MEVSLDFSHSKSAKEVFGKKQVKHVASIKQDLKFEVKS